jgi:hypothetical protein
MGAVIAVIQAEVSLAGKRIMASAAGIIVDYGVIRRTIVWADRAERAGISCASVRPLWIQRYRVLSAAIDVVGMAAGDTLLIGYSRGGGYYSDAGSYRID